MRRTASRLLLVALLVVPGSLFMTSCGQETIVSAPAPVTVSVYPPAASVLVNGTVQFVASGDGTSYTWSVNGKTGGDSTVGTITSSGLYAAPVVPPSSGSVTIRATSTSTTPASGAAVVSVTKPAPATVSVYPPTASVLVSGTIQFAASGAGTSYTWAVNGTTGGDGTVGTITAGGLYAAPSVPPSGSVTVTATSAASGNPTGNALITVTNPVPVVTSVSPDTIFTGSGDTTITVRGSQFQPSSIVKVGGETLVTQYWSSTQLTAVVPAFLLAGAAAHTIRVVTPGPGGGLDDNGILTVLAAGVVTSTGHPLVAKYSISIPRDATVTVEFGPDTNYGRRTWTRPTPAGGGQVEILVAGMRQFSSYHMRAIVEFPAGTQFLDLDHIFNTGGLPPVRTPQIAVSHPNPGPQNGGVELLDLLPSPTTGVAGPITDVVTDLDGNILWYYDLGTTLETFPFPIRGPLANGNFLIVNNSAGTAGTGGAAGDLLEVDLAGTVIRSLDGDTLNQELTAAGFNVQMRSMHHDVIQLGNGHIILLTNAIKDFTDLPGYAGVTTVTGDVIIDLDQNLQPVWVWNSFDHLDINRHPISFPDWTHGNALTYSPDDGNLLFSMRHQNWVIKIDYADGIGTGNILWKLGYQGDFTIASGLFEDWFYTQHFPIFVSPNSTGVFTLAVFDNGFGRVFSDGRFCSPTSGPDVCYSRTPIFQIDEINKVAQLVWPNTYNQYSIAVGSVVVFENGNVEGDLGILGSSAQIQERTESTTPQVVWQMDITGQWAYRAYRIPSLYPGVQW